MKLSVSVPDDLWNEARQSRPDLNPSHLVQDALIAWTRQRATDAFPQDRPPDADAAFSTARARLAASGREDFERGYRAAILAVESFSLVWFESLARARFDVVAWADGIADTERRAAAGQIPSDWAPDQQFSRALADALGSLFNPFGFDTFMPGVAYLRGFTKAMRDLWEGAIEGVALAEAPPDPESTS